MMSHHELYFLLLLTGVFATVFSPPELGAEQGPTTYDYVVVGCGIAGLVVSMRLTENANVSVVCLEAGPFDHYEESILFPQFIGRNIGSIYDWNVTTAPQTQLDGGTRPLPLGKVVGGGSIINGMVWNRGNRDDYDSWESLGNRGWSWSDLLPYFQKSETYTPVMYEGVENQPVNFIADAHGWDGPISVSYPKHYWPQSDNWFKALNEAGVPTVFDPQEGIAAGGYFLPSDIHPENQTRSDARRNYFDPFSSRKNYDVLDNSHVTRILFDSSDPKAPPPGSATPNDGRGNVGNSSTLRPHSGRRPGGRAERKGGKPPVPLRAVGVEHASSASSARKRIYARKEVILAAGAIHTPQILQLSGIGPSALLSELAIPVVQDLPGVGSNLQDHCLVPVSYPYQNKSLSTPSEGNHNTTFDVEASAEYRAFKTGPWTAMPSNALGFPSLPQIIPRLPFETAANLSDLLQTARKSFPSHLPSSYDATLHAGYLAQVSTLIPLLTKASTPAHEILNNNDGGLTVSLMHPLSRGTVHISSADPFSQPTIDPRWASHPLDLATLIAALQFNQVLLNTSAIRHLQPSLPAPSSLPFSSSSLTAHIHQSLRTEFHSCGTAAMAPREHGGVVDPRLKLYGSDNVRIVDGSIFPLVPGAHLQAVVYAVAEKAADLIKDDAAATAATATN